MLHSAPDNPMIFQLTEFVEKLETHAQSTVSFFDSAFLQIIRECFAYEDMAISVYDNFNYVGGVSSSQKSEQLLLYYQQHDFSKRDCVARYTSSNFEALTQNGNHSVLKGTDILSADPSGLSDYMDFLKSGDLQYVVVLLINRSFRLAVYKSAAVGDFSDPEIQLLSCILTIIRTRYQAFRKQELQNICMQTVSNIISHSGIGYVILSDEDQPLDNNITAAQFLYEMTEISHFRSAVNSALSLLAHSDTIRHGGYILTQEIHSTLNGYGLLNKYKILTIRKEKKKTAEAIPFHLLSKRETEILDCFAQGMEYLEITRRLHISENTIRTHLRNIYQKLGTNNQRKLSYSYSEYKAASADNL